jgi:transposase
MYWFHDAEYRAAKAAMIAYMDQGYRWNEAAQLAGVVVSRATAYRLWLRSWREGPSCLDDARHGHPAKLRAPIRDWLVKVCTAAPATPSPALQTTMQEQFGITVSVRQINRVRAALGVRAVRPRAPKKR